MITIKVAEIRARIEELRKIEGRNPEEDKELDKLLGLNLREIEAKEAEEAQKEQEEKVEEPKKEVPADLGKVGNQGENADGTPVAKPVAEVEVKSVKKVFKKSTGGNKKK